MSSAKDDQLTYLSAKMKKDGVKVIQSWIRFKLTLTVHNDSFRTLISQVAKLLINEALVQAGGNKSRAAKLLGFSRPTMIKKMRKFGIP